jgi:phosphoribosyl-ATP pyrophosphohydrolase
MNLDLFQLHLNQFVKDHKLPMDIRSRVRKCREEALELSAARLFGTQEDIEDEALDCLITAFLALEALQVKNPLFKAYLKLLRVREREEYKALRGETENEPILPRL